MHRVSALLSWDRRKSAQTPPNLQRLSTTASSPPKLKKEAFWPSTLDQECEKAARILKSFCSDGCLTPPGGDRSVTSPTRETAEPESQSPVNLVKRIPKRIVQNAAGIAIFTCMRSGMWMTGSGGSGILIARKADGTWSPPSALLLHTPTLSFVIGVDIYDCVLVINNLSALESIMQPQVTLGEDIGLSNGPMVALGSGEEEIRWKDLGNTVLTYLKAKGQVQTVNLNGCILTERGNENERFYGGNATMMDILAGNVYKIVDETRPLFEVIKQAEGRSDFDSNIVDQISSQCAPGDAVIESRGPTPPESPSRMSSFGVPDMEDPDPFGVLALEMAGLEIREAGTQMRPSSSQFDFAPSPTSPLFPRFKRRSVDTVATRSNRNSCLSVRTEHMHATDAYTQTEASITPHTTPSLSQSEDGHDRQSLEKAKGLDDVIEEEVDYTKIDFSPIQRLNGPSLDGATVVESPATTDDDRDAEHNASSDEAKPPASAPTSAPTSPDLTPELKPEDEDDGDDADDEDDEDDEDYDEPVVVFEVASAVKPVRTNVTAVRSQVVQAKGAIVTIPKRVPPPLPLRNPARSSLRASRSDFGDASSLAGTPSRASFASEKPETPARNSFASGIKSEGADGESEARLSQETPVKTTVDVDVQAQTPVAVKTKYPLSKETPADAAVVEEKEVSADDASVAHTDDALTTKGQVEIEEGTNLVPRVDEQLKCADVAVRAAPQGIAAA
ncbi:related to YSC84 - protein involved in the organization of the actin cytoskeleton [Cephalotrichum gorgonifer]|uniref:Related to YSC84 - protein involved in the organization of the actin cytoskeleton n=1 Tax=Cephalotrichum gorgonifer TaxID=2041049 RepID=A0AAE8N6W7_9PEZI|nr:related to YSC84 - protein involved in the organization of the actin cytoskeleton [Cephalotrichum gorgonifer]